MKWIYRGAMVGLCIALWFCLFYASADIGCISAGAPYESAFSFPCLLQGTEVYLWSLTSGEDGACLTLQNIGEKTISGVEIVFLSYGERLVFKATDISPRGKIQILEENSRKLRNDGAVICSTFTVR